jgi:hypothetical protein
MAFMARVTDMLHRLCILHVHNCIRIVERHSLHQVGIVSNHAILQYDE